MRRFHPVCAVEQLEPGCARLVRIGEKEIALFNVAGEYFAIEETCLHAGGPLHEGTIEGCSVRCPFHDWLFDLETGRCDLNPKVRLDRYPVRVRAGRIEVFAG